MWRSMAGCSILAFFPFVPLASAQTYEELKKENQELKARLKDLEAAAGAQAVVVSYDPATGKLVVKTGERERTIVLKPRTHVHDPEGYEVRPADRAEKLKPGVKIEIVEEDGELVEINIGGGKHGHKHEGDHKHNGHAHDEHGYDYFKPAHSHARDREQKCQRDAAGSGHNHDEDEHQHGKEQAKGQDGDKHGQEIKSFCDKRSWYQEDAHAHADNGHGNGHNGHGSVEGYPFLHFNRIGPAYLDRALEFTGSRSKRTEGGLFDASELETELIWALNSRIEFELAAPFIRLDPTGRPGVRENERGGAEVFNPRGATGFGDLGVALNFLAFNGERLKLKFGLAVTAPTGNDSRGLGAGSAVLEPVAFGLLDLGGGTVLQGEAAFEMPVHVDEVGNEFRYGLGLAHTFLGTEHWRLFRWLTPMIEANCITAMNGPEAGRTVVDLTPGLHWIMREHDDVGFGVSFPLSGSKEFDYQFLFKYLIHF